MTLGVIRSAPDDATNERHTDSDGLAERIRAGDSAAFEALFRATAPGLCASLVRYVASRSEAEDIVQDVFASLWARRETLAVRESLTTYVYIAARNRAWSLRARARRRTTLITAAATRSSEPDTGPGAPAPHDLAELIEERELTQALAHAVAALPPRCRESFIMSRRDGMTYPQIAATLGVSVKTVETQIGRAMKAIRRHVRAYL